MRSFKLQATAASLVTGVPDNDQFRWVFPQFDYIPTMVRYMREQHLSVFHDPNSWLIGQPLDAAFHVAAPDECTGALESSVEIVRNASERGLRLTGWAWDYQRREPPLAIVVATEGTIVGVGAMGDWRPINRNIPPRGGQATISDLSPTLGWVNCRTRSMCTRFYAGRLRPPA